MKLTNILRCTSILVILLSIEGTAQKQLPLQVKAYEQNVIIPTYLQGKPEPDPMFYLGRAYQGAEGRVYPYPLYDKLTTQKQNKSYKMVYLENEYIKVGILPELGGRIFSALDKTNNYSFFYTQHVIKPALIGMLGAWISGGVEWNIPHHHRASSLLPVQYSIEANKDGSKTVWIGEMELRQRMRWAVGYTIMPGRSYLTTSVKIINRTPFENSMLCFANAAVHTNDDYQIIFPPSTQYVTHHSKVQFTTWPVATTTYGGSDFSGGVDVSMYKNHQLANSMFAWNYEDNFVGGYDHGKQAGTLCVANQHTVPGKKFWTWGSGPGGKLWDHILTDEDGPYIELMVGAYSDNQPDYSWMQPYEERNFDQYWMPIRNIGGVKKATKDAALNLEIKDGYAEAGVYTSAAYNNAQLVLRDNGKEMYSEKMMISPAKPFTKRWKLPAGTKAEDVSLSFLTNGHEMLAYQPTPFVKQEMPEKVTLPLALKDIKTNEELYLAGLRIDQFHNPALEPDTYWKEALSRDSSDARVNTSMGINMLKKAMYPEAERYFRKAINRVSAKYTTPKDGEPYYYLGIALKQQGMLKEAYDAFYKATWSYAWVGAAYYALAEIDGLNKDYATGLDHLDRALNANALNTKALALQAAFLRNTNKKDEMQQTLLAAHKADPLDVRFAAERWLANQSVGANELKTSLANFPENGLEIAADLSNAGLWSDAVAVLNKTIEAAPDKSKVSPMAYYYLGYFSGKMGETAKAKSYYSKAAAMPPDYVFPFQYEAIAALKDAMQANPTDAYTSYYLGNLLYDWQPKEAMKMWELSRSKNENFSILHRNLAVGYAAAGELDKAIASLEKAISLPDRKAIHFFELDDLYEAAGATPDKRLAVLEKYHSIVNERDDALSKEIALKVNNGKYEDAIGMMKGRHFNVWEGGARFSVNDYWTDAYLLSGKQYLDQKKYTEAIKQFQTALEFPANLQTARNRYTGRNAEVDYWLGLAYDKSGNKTEAAKYWESSSAKIPKQGSDDVLPTTNQTVLLYYQAKSLEGLGKNKEARAIYDDLIKAGKKAMQQSSEVNFFAKFGQQQSERNKQAMAHYITSLGYMGRKDNDEARKELAEALKVSPDHLGAKTALAMLNNKDVAGIN